jgi:hypothetical protein
MLTRAPWRVKSQASLYPSTQNPFASDWHRVYVSELFAQNVFANVRRHLSATHQEG